MTNLYRQKALAQMASPEQLDQRIEVLGAKGWWWLSTLALGLGGVLAWSIFGRIPITVSGQGVLAVGRRIIPLQSLATGRIAEIKVRADTVVRKGDILAVIDQPELTLQIKQKEREISETKQSIAKINAETLEDSTLERQNIESQKQSVREQILNSTSLGESLKTQNANAVAEKQETLREQLNVQRTATKNLGEVLSTRRNLLRQGLISQDVVIQAEQQYIQSQSQIGNLETRLQELEVQRVQNEQQYIQTRERIVDLRVRLNQLTTQESQLRTREAERRLNATRQLEELERALAQLRLQLAQQQFIRSPFDGRIVRVWANIGQGIQSGSTIGQLERSDINEPLSAKLFLTIGDGKRVESGDRAIVTPSTVRRTDYGGILGQVRSISPSPETLQDVAALVGDVDFAQSLIAGNRLILVDVDLEEDKDKPSGFRWSSGEGTKTPPTGGTTVDATITIEERRPISFVIPLLRQITGVE